MRAIRFTKLWHVRFSLRAALGVMAAVSIWLGMLASSARQQRLAIEQLRSVNATVGYNTQHDDLWVPSWIRARVGDDFFGTVTEVSLNEHFNGHVSSPLPPGELKTAVDTIRRLPGVRGVTFNHTGVRDDDMRQLAPLADQIESLYFKEPRGQLTGEGLRHFAGWPRLRSVSILAAHLDGAALRHVTELPALESLVWNGYLDDAAFGIIARCARLKNLSLCACMFDGNSLRKLIVAPNLRTIMLQNCAPKPAGMFWTTDEKGKIISESPPASYQFVPAGMDGTILSDQHYRQWINQLLPGITIYDMESSN